VKVRRPKEVRRPKPEGRSETRRPRSEGRKKAEIRNPTRTFHGDRPLLTNLAAHHRQATASALRISPFGFRPSGFGLRIFITFGLLTSVRLLAATNESASEETFPPLPRPPRPEIPPTVWEQYGVWIVILGVLLLAMLAGVVWWLTRPKPPVIEPAAVRARHELEPLRQRAENGLVLSRVSQVLRHYVAGAFNLPPEELTTTEFCRALARSEQVGPELSTEMGEFLRECDRRKFAVLPILPPLGAVAQAAKFIEQAEVRRTQLMAAAAAAAAAEVPRGQGVSPRSPEQSAAPK
jgi:hypothetical protein